ncbi:MAG: ABC transporter permease subunit [Planctomycetota bacterium]
MIPRIWRLIKIELFKLSRQKLTYIAVLIIILTILGTIFLTKSETGINSFSLLSRALLSGLRIGALFILIIGCLSIASETTSGTIKTVLISPIHRSELFLAKAITLIIITALITLLIETIAYTAVWLGFGLSDITDPTFKDYIYIHKAEMLRYTVYTFFMVFLPLISISFFGLFISSVVENAGIAVAVGILLYIFMDYFIIGLLPRVAPYIFIYYLDYFPRTLADLSEGILGQIWKFTTIDYLLGIRQQGDEIADYLSLFKTRIIPLAYIVVFAVIGFIAVRRKDII